jgi:hypothetical protein
MTKPSSTLKLDRLISSLESAIGSATDREILALPGARADAHAVRRIIENIVEAEISRRSEVIPRSASERRRLLEMVVGSKMHIPNEIRMAYSSTKQVSDKEISAHLEKLLRMGLLKKLKS